MEKPSDDEIKEIFTSKTPPTDPYDLLRQWKASGMTQEECYELLTGFRARTQLSEDEDDCLLDWMDVVVGWSSPEIKIW